MAAPAEPSGPYEPGGVAPGMSGHGHAELPATGGAHRLTAALSIAATMLVIEVIGTIVSGSLALLADAAHLLTDVAGLSLAVLAARLVRRPAAGRRTWGYRRAEVLAAAAQAAILLAVGTYVVIEALRRLWAPPDVNSSIMLVFGLIGLIGNALAIGILARGRGENLNTRAAFLEVVNDALGSVAVIVAAIVIATTGFLRADALASLLIGALILPRTYVLLRDTIDVLLESAPRGVDLAQVRAHLAAVDHVQGVHDLHASTVATGLPVLSAHVVVDADCFQDGHVPRLLDELQECLRGHFDVEHSTLQFEPAGHVAHEPDRHA